MRRRGFLLSLLLMLGTGLSGLAALQPDGTAAGGGQDSAFRAEAAVQPAGPPANVPDRRRLEPGKVDSWRDLCHGPKSIRLSESNLCTHGSDRTPREFTAGQSVALLTARVARQEAATISCTEDGENGYRVQVLYVRGTNVGSRYQRMLSSIQGWAGAANRIFEQSAAATGGSRSLRFVLDADCAPTVREVVVSPAGDGAFGTTVEELQSQGYDRTDRIYLAFVDTVDAGICGIGTLWNDDRASADNWNNFGPSYARVDAECWSGEVAAHEVMHNLGGVQFSAPNSSGAFHCIDEYDLMCYRDSAQSPSLRYDCPNPDDDQTQLDCGHQDYYHTNPPAGSYLASYWNPANNQFLVGGAVSPQPDDTTQNKHEKKDKRDRKGKKHHRRHHRH